ncbi:MAG TPA: Wzz/FepE/Etk N-terminal domain-containing protein [Pyrinomonadaceae bacterium]|nr:Wzz/FepE/Etk N-terminal domain-containing protein [Pyrinomonadaceae bacterium]
MTRQLTTGLGNSSISVRDGASALFRRRALVLFTFLAVITGTIIISLILPNRYSSRMKILVKNQRVDLAITPEATTGGAAPTVDNEVSENQINSEIELLTSNDLLTQVVNETGLAKDNGGLFGGPTTEAARVERAVTALAKDLTITPVRKANIISISYSSGSPQMAAAVLKTVGELYLEKHLKLHHPAGASDFFKDKAEEYETQLKQAEQRLTDFQQSNNLVVLGQQKDLTLVKTADAKARMLEAETALSEATNRITRVEEQLAATPRRIVTQSKQLPNQYSAERLNTMLVELQNKRTQLLTKFRPEDRLVREADEQIRLTREALAKAEQKTNFEEATDLNPLRQNLETELARARLDQVAARARRDALAGQLRQYESDLKTLEGNTAKHDDLQREKKEAEENYQLYAKKREEARIADELDRQKITNVSIAEAATVPQIPSSPNRSMNLIIGIVLAGFLSLGSVFTAELFSDAVHTPRQLEALTGAPVLATVPANSRRMMSRANREDRMPDRHPVAELKS